MASRHLDRTREGSRTYTASERQRVVEAFRAHVGPSHAIRTVDLAEITGIDGRTVRAILADADAVEFLIGGHDDGRYVCALAGQGESLTRTMQAEAMSLLERVNRRKVFARELGGGQSALF